MENKLTNDSFSVPCTVVDILLKIASGEQLKVLLYLLRNNINNTDAGIISENTGVSRQDVESAISFWKNCNIISKENSTSDSGMGSMFTPVYAITESAPPKTQIIKTSQPVTTEIAVKNDAPVKRVHLRPNEIQEIIDTNADIAELVKALQVIVANLNHVMVDSAIWIYNYYALKGEVIAILFTYCSSIDALNIKYIEKMAETWAERGINTLEEAQKEVTRLANIHTYNYEIMKMFEMKRTPTTSQQKIVDEWYEKNIPMELIKYAYEKTIENIEKLSFPYINRILISWTAQGFKTLEDVMNAEKVNKNNYIQKKVNVNSDGFNADDYNIVINNL